LPFAAAIHTYADALQRSSVSGRIECVSSRTQRPRCNSGNGGAGLAAIDNVAAIVTMCIASANAAGNFTCGGF